MPVLWSSLSIHLGIICYPFCPPSGAKSALLIVLFNDLGKPSRTKSNFLTLLFLSSFLLFFRVILLRVFGDQIFWNWNIFQHQIFLKAKPGLFSPRANFPKATQKNSRDQIFRKRNWDPQRICKCLEIKKSEMSICRGAQKSCWQIAPTLRQCPERQRIFIAGLPLNKGGQFNKKILCNR